MAHSLHVFGGSDAAFADQGYAVGDLARQFVGDVEGGMEGAEVAVVYTYQVGFGFEGCGEFALVVDFYQALHTALFGERLEFADDGDVQHGDDEQDGVGAVGAGFVNLVGVEDELFTQDGADGGMSDGSSGFEVLEATLEVVFVGED